MAPELHAPSHWFIWGFWIHKNVAILGVEGPYVSIHDSLIWNRLNGVSSRFDYSSFCLHTLFFFANFSQSPVPLNGLQAHIQEHASSCMRKKRSGRRQEMLAKRMMRTWWKSQMRAWTNSFGVRWTLLLDLLVLANTTVLHKLQTWYLRRKKDEPQVNTCTLTHIFPISLLVVHI